MKRITPLGLLIVAIAIGCEDNNSNNPVDEFTATVVNANDFTACGLPLINFTEKTNEIQKLTGSTGTTFNAFQLKKEFQIEGLKLNVKVRKTRDDELRPCLTLGLGLPWVTILEAKVVN